MRRMLLIAVSFWLTSFSQGTTFAGTGTKIVKVLTEAALVAAKAVDEVAASGTTASKVAPDATVLKATTIGLADVARLKAEVAAKAIEAATPISPTPAIPDFQTRLLGAMQEKPAATKVAIGVSKVGSNPLPSKNIIPIESIVRAFKDKKFISLSDVSPSYDKEVFVGVDYSGHAFLVVGGRQIHPQPLGKTKITTAKGIVNDGVLVRANLEPETVANLMASVDSFSDMRSLTCAQGVCKILRDEAGLVIGSGNLIDNLRPTKVISDILADKISGPDGLTFDVFISPTKDLSKFMSSGAIVENGLMLTWGAIGVTAVYVTAQGVTEVFLIFTNEEPQQDQ